MKSILRYKVNGSSLVEVLIALVILSFTSMLAVIIYNNIQSSNKTFFKLKAVEIAESEMNSSIDKKLLIDETKELNGYLLNKKIVRHSSFLDCVILTINVFDGNKNRLFQLNRIVKVN